MFEILTKEQVEKMSDRELKLSEDYYRHNLCEITHENYQRSLSTTNEPIAENLPVEATVIKTRGRKKKSK